MKRFLGGCLTLVLYLAANVCSAAVFERDWKMPGDGLLTYDDVNRREWLDVSVSRLDQFPEPRLENAVAEIGPGRLFEGFTWAKTQDVFDLAHSAQINTTTTDLAINQASTTQLIGLLGPTLETLNTIRSVGLISETSAVTEQVGADFFVIFSSFLPGRAGLSLPAAADTVFSTDNGLLLYRTIPEPSPISLAFGILLPLIYRVRQRRNCANF